MANEEIRHAGSDPIRFRCVAVAYPPPQDKEWAAGAAPIGSGLDLRRGEAHRGCENRRGDAADRAGQFNTHGPNGLIDKKALGQPSKLEDTHRAALAKMIDEGPIPALHGVVRGSSICASGFSRNSASLCPLRP